MSQSSDPTTEQVAILGDFQLSPAQAAAAQARGTDVAVRAGAGTGKTRTLVGRFLSLLASGVPLRSIVAVTFTRKAAWEMRNRIRAVVAAAQNSAERPSAAGADLVSELDAARIGTIHSFCAEILRNHPAEVGIDPYFGTLDETQSALLVTEALETALAWAVSAPAALPALELLGEQATRDLLADFVRQRTAVALAFASGPSGDTLLAHWSALLQQAQRDLARALLSDPALHAARERLARQQASDPHDLAEVARQTAVAALTALQEAWDSGGAGWQPAYASLCAIRLTGGRKDNWPGGVEQVQEIKTDIALLRAAWQSEALFEAAINQADETVAAVWDGLKAIFEEATRSYQRLKDEQGALDFDDLENLAIELLQEHEGARAYWQDTVQALLVDEFQDTNERQRELFRLLCPGSGKLFIVGDAKQSIYRFRGADVSVFHREVRDIQAARGEVILLDESYRAHAGLLQAMNELLAPVLGPEDAARPWRAPFAALQPALRAEPRCDPPFMELHLGLGTKEQALPVATQALIDRVVTLLAETGLSYGDVAILCRASTSFRFYEDALDAASVPYVTVAGRGFYERPEVRDLLNALRTLDDPNDDLALAGLLRSPAFGLSDAALFDLRRAALPDASLWTFIGTEQGREAAGTEKEIVDTAVALIDALHKLAGRATVADVLKRFVDETRYRAALRRAGESRALRNVTKLLEDVQRSERISIAAFLDYAQALRDSGSREGEARAADEGAVQIMTVHQAKGLEFPLVILGDMGYRGPSRKPPFLLDEHVGLALFLQAEEDVSPGLYVLAAQREQELADAENSRLFYVAATRAREMLFFSGHATLTTKGKLSTSGWLGELAAVCSLGDEVWGHLDSEGQRAFSQDQSIGEAVVHLTIYEGGHETALASQAQPVPPPLTELTFPLLAPLPPAAPARDDDRRETFLYPVVSPAARASAPHRVIGDLVHEALALWRFPDDDFAAWLEARAREKGLNDRAALRDAISSTARVLRRFRASPLFTDLDRADVRLHEVPYSISDGSGVDNGRIDLLARMGPSWFVIDYKIEAVRDHAAIQKVLRDTRKDYQGQMRRYLHAVQLLHGIEAQGMICFLDGPDGPYPWWVDPRLPDR